MTRWKAAGLIATVVIVLSFPLYHLKMERRFSAIEEPSEAFSAAFVGSLRCKDCHKNEYDKWRDSHHDRAMDIAAEATVLGDFNNILFEWHGIQSRFYRRDGRFFVYTQGPEGKMGEFEITHTFGWHPLQQYLVPFPGGRLQCLPIAWDVKGKKWYHLYPQEPLEPSDWLYWTNAGQNWNGMCAECHSTNLKKNYDLNTKTYHTTWSDIDVGCEACHGPGSRHVAWAELPEMARPKVENVDLAVKTSRLGSRDLVELCAPCHSRRSVLGDYTHAEKDLLDSLLPTLLLEGLYFPDGQILEEVYVYGSFTQSKMYHRDVRCTDCHDVHSVKPLKEGNALCLQCHRAGEYDTKAHHFHKKRGEKGDPIRSPDGRVVFEVGTGAECVQCHMPGRYYMGIDYRPDHSFRIPRPDIGMRLEAPDACIRCHVDKTPRWSDEQITQWYGPGRRPHYGTILAAGRKGDPRARQDLIRLAGDVLYPVIVRATALSLLSHYRGEDTVQAFQSAMMDDEALIRRTAIDSLNLPDPERLAEMIGPMLYDPVKAVRIEAAQKLAGSPSYRLKPDQTRPFDNALEEYVMAMEYSADFSFGRYNLGNLSTALGRTDEAVRHYEAALEIDDLFYTAKVNLAVLFSQQGRNDKAEKLLRETLEAYPENGEAAYSLGLLLVEMNRHHEAIVFLEKAAKQLPDRGRVHYNLGLLLQRLKRDSEAEAVLLDALKIEPGNLDFLYAAAQLYMKIGNRQKAREMAVRIISSHPNERIGYDLLRSQGRP